MEEEPVSRGSRESGGARGVESYIHKEEVVGQAVVSVSSGGDVDAGVEAKPALPA